MRECVVASMHSRLLCSVRECMHACVRECGSTDLSEEGCGVLDRRTSDNCPSFGVANVLIKNGVDLIV
jgi:hypothetical protein